MRGMAKIVECERVAVINIISLRRLIVGGAAMFAHEKRNHHNDKIGAVIRIPPVNTTLRVCVVSYVMFARQNIAEDTRPWAIIIARPPYIPNEVLDITPATISPICPTDE